MEEVIVRHQWSLDSIPSSLAAKLVVGKRGRSRPCEGPSPDGLDEGLESLPFTLRQRRPVEIQLPV